MKKESGHMVWITFIGLILLLLGIYSSARTAINLAFFEKYPTSGTLSIIPLGIPPFYGPREEDCMMMSSPPMPVEGDIKVMPYPYDADNQKNSCLESVRQSREQAKINDISQSLLFLFLGAGVLHARKKLFS